jgi:hypothetical protein
VSDLKRQRLKARDLKAPIPHDAGCELKSELHSEYLTVAENQRRAENEVRSIPSIFHLQ